MSSALPARTSLDCLSDKDVLVTAQNLSIARPQIQVLKDSGWSVAAYSHSRLIRMASMGSLFIQHLKLEGKILWDKDCWLESLLDNFFPKKCYENEIVASFDLIRPLERIMHANPNSHMASDLGYIFIRNFAINRLASEQTYIFDYKSLIEELQGSIGYSDNCRDKLLGLREGKHMYRSGIAVNPCTTMAQEVAAMICEACPSLKLQAIPNGTQIRELDLPYATLRDCEAELIIRRHGIDPDAIYSEAMDKIWKMIGNPREYSWRVRSIDKHWLAATNKILFGPHPATNGIHNETWNFLA